MSAAVRSDYDDRPVRRQLDTMLTSDQEAAIGAWLALIEEADPSTIAEVVAACMP